MRIRPPLGKQNTEVSTVDVEFAEEICVATYELLADIRDAVGVDIGQLTSENLALVNDAVLVAVGVPFDDNAIAVSRGNARCLCIIPVGDIRVRQHAFPAAAIVRQARPQFM